ncbi:MAG: hypothetical protein FJX77_18070, partial [Armatimonadetes bacterium]|nr:hypothetical protein [Armatimonadota bacterium]
MVNYAASATGSVRVELQDAAGNPLPGFHLEDSAEIYGDELDRRVTWKGNPSLETLAGRPVRLRFRLEDADLYSFVFSAPGAGGR